MKVAVLHGFLTIKSVICWFFLKMSSSQLDLCVQNLMLLW